MGLDCTLPAPRSGCTLQTLSPAQLLPERYTERSKVMTSLRRIEHIEIRDSVKRRGNRYYVIGIYYRLSTSHIPTLCEDPHRVRRDREPDVLIERRYSEFGNMRDEMYYHAHSGHGDRPCQFCARLVGFLGVSRTQPYALAKFINREASIRRLLGGFLREILAHTLRVAACGAHCDGQEEIPRLVKEFLLPSYSASSGRSSWVALEQEQEQVG